MSKGTIVSKDDVKFYGTVIATVGFVGLVFRAVFRGLVEGQSEFPGTWADAMTSFPNPTVVSWLIFGGAAIGGLAAYAAHVRGGVLTGGGIAVWMAVGLVGFGLVPAAIALVIFVLVWLFSFLIVVLVLGLIAAFLYALLG